MCPVFRFPHPTGHHLTVQLWYPVLPGLAAQHPEVLLETRRP
jgi:hypothetical protein